MIYSWSASVYSLGKTLRTPSLFHPPPLTHEIFWDEHVTQVPVGWAVLGDFQILLAQHRVLLSRTFPYSSFIGISFTIRWSFIGTNLYWQREGDKKHTKQAEWNITSPLRIGCWLSHSKLVTHRRWRDSGKTSTPWLLTECPGASQDMKPEKGLQLISQWLRLSSKTKLDLIPGFPLLNCVNMAMVLNLSC